MHELSVATSVVDLALQHTGGRKLTAVNLAVGANAGIFRESLLLYMGLVLEEKGIKDVKVAWRDVPMHCRCDCGTEYDILRYMDTCPSCGSFQRAMEGGRDCTVDSIEVEDV